MSTTVLLVDDHPLMRSALRTAIETICEDCIFIPAGSLEEAFHELRRSNPPDLVILDLNLPDACGTATLDAFHRRHPALKLVVLSERDDAATVQAAQEAGVLGFIPKTASVEQCIGSLRQILAGSKTFPPASPPVPASHVLPHPDSLERLAPEAGASSRHNRVADPVPVWQVHRASHGNSRTPWGLPSTPPARIAAAQPGPQPIRNTAAASSADKPAMTQVPSTPPREYNDGRHLGLTERQRGVLRLMMLGMPNKAICRELHLAEGTVKVHVSAVLRALGVTSRAQVTVAALRAGVHIE